MGRTVKQIGQFKIYRASTGYNLHNTRYPFEEKHTHLQSLSTAEYVARKAKGKKIPHDASLYVLESIARVTDSSDHSVKIRELIKLKLRKRKCVYINAK